jgi:curli biogenesis system outer membrane secretion channel CsgG
LVFCGPPPLVGARRRGIANRAIGIEVRRDPAETMRPRRPQIAVLPFDFGTIQNQWWGQVDIGRGVADQIVDSLVNDGAFSVIERSKLDTLLAEQDFAQTDRAAIESAKLAQVGKVLGVRYLVAGSITQFHTSDRRFGGGVAGAVAKGMLGPVGGLSFRKVKHQVKLTARLIDTSTGEVVASAEGSGESKKGQGVGVEMAEGQSSGFSFSMTSADYRQSGMGEAQEKATASLVLALLEKKPAP